MNHYQCECGWLVHSNVTIDIACPECGSIVSCEGVPHPVGLGDVVEKVIARLGGNYFKRAYYCLFRRPCGCDKRKEAMNALGMRVGRWWLRVMSIANRLANTAHDRRYYNHNNERDE